MAGWSGSSRLSDLGVELARVAPTQDVLYADIDLALSCSERELTERERTKNVHRLHPYLGKFIPQLVEILLSRYFRPGQHVLDPRAQGPMHICGGGTCSGQGSSLKNGSAVT